MVQMMGIKTQLPFYAAIGRAILAKATIQTFFLSYFFLATIFSNSVFTFRYFPAYIKTTLITYHVYYFFAAYLFILYLCINRFKFFIDRYIILMLLYLLTCCISLVVNGYVPQQIAELLRSTFFPMTLALFVIQIMTFRNFPAIYKIIVLFAVLNIIASFLEILLVPPRMSLLKHFAGAFTDRNLLARFLCFANSILVSSLILNRNDLLKRSTTIVLILLIFADIVLLLSRSGYVLYLVSIVLTIALADKKILKQFLKWAMPGIIILFGFMAVKRIVAEKMYVKNESDLGRLSVMSAGVNMFLHNPTFGIGHNLSSNPSLFRKYENKHIPGLVGITATHNSYIAVAAEKGAVGLTLYLLLNFGLLSQLYTISKRCRSLLLKRAAIITFNGLAIFAIVGLVYNLPDYEGVYWLVIALGIIVRRTWLEEIKTPIIQMEAPVN